MHRLSLNGIETLRLPRDKLAPRSTQKHLGSLGWRWFSSYNVAILASVSSPRKNGKLAAGAGIRTLKVFAAKPNTSVGVETDFIHVIDTRLKRYFFFMAEINVNVSFLCYYFWGKLLNSLWIIDTNQPLPTYDFDTSGNVLRCSFKFKYNGMLTPHSLQQ